MRTPVFWLLVLLLGGIVTLSLCHGQGQPRSSPLPPDRKANAEPGPLPALSPTPTPPAAPQEPTAVLDHKASRPASSAGAEQGPDKSRLTPTGREMLLAAQRGADWLYRMNGVKGRFLHGYLPDLNREMEGDHYLRQIGAASALARAARLTREPRYAVRAAQAILALLDETTVDPHDDKVRHTVLPSVVVNRLGAAGLLVLAINELPAPQADLLDRSEQLCAYIRRQLRSDGSLCCDDGAEAGKKDDVDCVNTYPGQALLGLMVSCKHRPAKWKLELARKTIPYYRAWWRKHHSLDFVCWQSAAAAEAYRLTREAAFAELVFAMNDWLCELQYDTIDPQRVLWYGGFREWVDGRAVETSPGARTALAAESLAWACRVARLAGDVSHHQHYREVLERSLQLIARLQYTEANTQHYAEWYRPRVLGAFHASLTDGSLRIDSTHHAVSALTLYVENSLP